MILKFSYVDHIKPSLAIMQATLGVSDEPDRELRAATSRLVST